MNFSSIKIFSVKQDSKFVFQEYLDLGLPQLDTPPSSQESSEADDDDDDEDGQETFSYLLWDL